MVDWLGLTSIKDIIEVGFDAYDRVRTPERLRGRTRYLLDLEERLEPYIGRHRNNDIPEYLLADLEHYEQQQQQQQRGATQNESFQSRLRAASRKARIALRRDDLKDILFDAEKKQEDKVREEIVNRTTHVERTLRKIARDLSLQPCINRHACKKLLSCKFVELDNVPRHGTDAYIPVFQKTSSPIPQPIWPLPKHAQQLFAEDDEYSKQRFDVLLAVVDTLVAAARAEWPHRRLSTTDIVVRYDLAPKSHHENQSHEKKDFNWYWNSSSSTSSTSTARFFDNARTYINDVTEDDHYQPSSKSSASSSSLGVLPIVQVLNFRCPITFGCTNSCPRCRGELENTIKLHGEEIISTRYRNFHTTHQNYNNVYFADAFGPPRRAVEDGVNSDIASLASFVLWLYTGIHATEGFKPLADENSSTMARVPWPLRFIIVDYFSEPNRKQSSRPAEPLFMIGEFLHALKDRNIRPHMLRNPLVPPISDSSSALLRAAAFRSSLAGARTDEPEAALHFGMLLEQDANIRNNDEIDDDTEANHDAREESTSSLLAKATTACTAYGSFACSAQYGEPLAFLKMAELQSKWIGGTVPRPCTERNNYINIGTKELLRCILLAASGGVPEALQILQDVPEVGVDPKNIRHLLRKRGVVNNAQADIDEILEEEERKINGSAGENVDQNRTTISTTENIPDVSNEMHFKLFNAIFNAAKCLRRGKAGMDPDLPEARTWLKYAFTVASTSSLQEAECEILLSAKLELALLHRQESLSPTTLHDAVDLVRELSECEELNVRNDALFWLGWWNYYGLIWHNTQNTENVHNNDVVIIPKDYNQAASYFREAAESPQPNKHAIAFLSRFHLYGLGPYHKNDEEGLRLNKIARKEGSMIAHCRYALELEGKARRLYRSRLQNIDENESTSSDEEDRLQSSDLIHGNNQQQSGTIQRRRRVRTGFLRALGALVLFHGQTSTTQASNVEDLDDDLVASSDNSAGNSTNGTPRARSRSNLRNEGLGLMLALRYEVDRLFKKAKNVLTKAIERFAGENPEEGFNPLPYFLVGRLIVKNKYYWTICSKDVNQNKITASTFEEHQMEEAERSFRKAALMYQTRPWRVHRVNFIEQDLHVMSNAKERFEKTFHCDV